MDNGKRHYLVHLYIQENLAPACSMCNMMKGWEVLQQRVRKHWGLRSQSTKIAGAVFTFQLPKKNKTVVLCCPTTAFEFILLESCQIPGGYRKLRGFVECCRHIATKHTEGAQTMMIGC